MIAAAIAGMQEYWAARGEVISAGEALARLADHFRETWEGTLKRKWGSKAREEVMMRNHGICAWPGCSRAADDDHHIVFRSQGGSDKTSNRSGLCKTHHLQGVHRGFLELTGRAGNWIKVAVIVRLL